MLSGEDDVIQQINAEIAPALYGLTPTEIKIVESTTKWKNWK